MEPQIFNMIKWNIHQKNENTWSRKKINLFFLQKAPNCLCRMGFLSREGKEKSVLVFDPA